MQIIRSGYLSPEPRLKVVPLPLQDTKHPVFTTCKRLLHLYHLCTREGWLGLPTLPPCYFSNDLLHPLHKLNFFLYLTLAPLFFSYYRCKAKITSSLTLSSLSLDHTPPSQYREGRLQDHWPDQRQLARDVYRGNTSNRGPRAPGTAE